MENLFTVMNTEVKEIELKDIPENPVAWSSKEAHKILKECFDVETIDNKMSFKILFLDANRKVTGVLDLSELENTSQIILAHNSPSDELKPTRLCYQTTKSIRQAGELIGLRLLDHIILNSSENYYSFADAMRL